MPIDHVNIRCSDLEGMRAFLEEAVGLKIGDRPDFDFPGHWMYDSDGQAVVHLVGVAASPDGTGPFDHVAFQVGDFDDRVSRLSDAGFEIRVAKVPGTQIRQAFVLGPEGVRVELQGLVS